MVASSGCAFLGSCGYWVVVLFFWCAFLCASVFGEGVRVSVSVGVCGCLGEGCVVGGGVVPVWLGDVVAGGGVGVSFDVGSRVFVLSGVSVPVSGSGASVSSPAASGSSLVGSLASECGERVLLRLLVLCPLLGLVL